MLTSCYSIPVKCERNETPESNIIIATIPPEWGELVATLTKISWRKEVLVTQCALSEMFCFLNAELIPNFEYHSPLMRCSNSDACMFESNAN